ncbi:hypothetical protein ISS85_01025 [Candidatus Microgenomates bacterium]|nr:hypothetical protein [Candidatus Microgenomates bacterium]
MKKLLILIFWLPATLLTLFSSFSALYFTQNIKGGSQFLQAQAAELAQKNQYQFTAALPEVLGSFTNVVTTGDARPEILQQFLEKHDSPLEPYADFIVKKSDEIGLDDPRLVVAIAMCESNVCKRIPEDSYNCWGFQNGSTKFPSMEWAIERVVITLKENYLDKGLRTPDEIMPKYAPPSVEKGGPWAKCVNQFLDELR